jgi:hypothetical protein
MGRKLDAPHGYENGYIFIQKSTQSTFLEIPENIEPIQRIPNPFFRQIREKKNAVPQTPRLQTLQPGMAE